MARKPGACSSNSSPQPRACIACVRSSNQQCPLLPLSACNFAVHFSDVHFSCAASGTRSGLMEIMEAPAPTPCSRHLRACGWKKPPRIGSSRADTLHGTQIMKQGINTASTSTAAASPPLQALQSTWIIVQRGISEGPRVLLTIFKTPQISRTH